MPLRRAHLVSSISAAITLSLASGCQQPAPQIHPTSHPAASTQATRDTTGGDRDARLEKLRRAEIQSLLDEALSAPAMDQRTAAALAAADRATGDVADTFRAISAARDLLVEDLRNVDTTAYKATRARVGGDGKLIATLDLSQGSLEATDRSLDVAIQGEGFFKVQMPGSSPMAIGYTRNGNFFVNQKGELVLALGDGYRLLPPITVPTDATDISISIGLDGTLQYTRAGTNIKQTAGLIQLAIFPNPCALRWLGGCLYIPTKTSGSPVDTLPGEHGAGQVLGGFLEASNVEVFREAARMRFLLEWRASLLRAINKPAP
ncbi:MAG TPA: hypothetical protein VFC78_02310 [Tepidisphaeraceae bacterium]|nr:hypothetical protein [Tepidisphaeraceae bacterium]